ncbi:unnamed protein product, partial [Ostreobium quekettii]|eukprot:evm.model.scf_457.1 EVM.evm.TU.scf_457.1   scf_457:8848-11524(-)
MQNSKEYRRGEEGDLLKKINKDIITGGGGRIGKEWVRGFFGFSASATEQCLQMWLHVVQSIIQQYALNDYIQRLREELQNPQPQGAHLPEPQLHTAQPQEHLLQGPQLQNPMLQRPQMQGSQVRGPQQQQALVQGVLVQGVQGRAHQVEGFQVPGSQVQVSELQGSHVHIPQGPQAQVSHGPRQGSQRPQLPETQGPQLQVSNLQAGLHGADVQRQPLVGIQSQGLQLLEAYVSTTQALEAHACVVQSQMYQPHEFQSHEMPNETHCHGSEPDEMHVHGTQGLGYQPADTHLPAPNWQELSNVQMRPTEMDMQHGGEGLEDDLHLGLASQQQQAHGGMGSEACDADSDLDNNPNGTSICEHDTVACNDTSAVLPENQVDDDDDEI